jgi:hypothetical protein
MNEQGTLFGVRADTVQDKPKPLSHRGDPQTSREAAEWLRESGKLAAQQQAVLEGLRQCDGSTHGELGRFMGVDWFIPARRLSELERERLVLKGQARICRINGTKCVTGGLSSRGDRNKTRRHKNAPR